MPDSSHCMMLRLLTECCAVAAHERGGSHLSVPIHGAAWLTVTIALSMRFFSMYVHAGTGCSMSSMS